MLGTVAIILLARAELALRALHRGPARGSGRVPGGGRGVPRRLGADGGGGARGGVAAHAYPPVFLVVSTPAPAYLAYVGITDGVQAIRRRAGGAGAPVT